MFLSILSLASLRMMGVVCPYQADTIGYITTHTHSYFTLTITSGIVYQTLFIVVHTPDGGIEECDDAFGSIAVDVMYFIQMRLHYTS